MKVSHSFKRLLTSQTRLKLINILFSAPSELYYVRELVRLTAEEINSVRRELDNLTAGSIIIRENRGNRVYYWPNPDHHLFYDLVVLAHKHTGIGANIQEHHLKLGKIRALFFSQDFLGQQSQNQNNIDLLIVGEISLKLIEEIIKSEETKIGREINYMVMDRNEMHLRISKRDPVLVDFFLKYPALIIGNPKNLFK